MKAAACIDAPGDNAVVQRHGFALSGWLVPEDGETAVTVVASTGTETLGATSRLYGRPDVDDALSLSKGRSAGFAIDCFVPLSLRDRSALEVVLEVVDDRGCRRLLGTRRVRMSATDYRTAIHGYVFEPWNTAVLHREQIYASGPPSPVADPSCVDFVFRYLPPDARTLDVGCGVGAYGRVFRERGRPWVGCEVHPEFVAAARADGLDVRLGGRGFLPFDDGSFDAALAIEVIEHVEDVSGFIAEMHRVAPRLALVSVPNFEIVPITATLYALPWHMLEPDHKNFFTHLSLAAALRERYASVEVLEYGTLPLRSRDDLPLQNHLFAVAWNDR